MARTAGIVAALVIAFMVTEPLGDAGVGDAVSAAGCNGILVVEPGPTGVLQISASECSGSRANLPGIPLDGDLAAAAGAAWGSDRTEFSALGLTVYRVQGDERRAPRSVLLSAVQLQTWFGPRQAAASSLHVRLDDLANCWLWLLLPVAGLALCVLIVAAARSGRLMIVWVGR